MAEIEAKEGTMLVTNTKVQTPTKDGESLEIDDEEEIESEMMERENEVVEEENESEWIITHSQLLQSIKHVDSRIVDIPIESCMSLILSFNKLENENKVLHSQVNSMMAAFHQIDHNIGPSFTSFPNLPLEIQRAIWEFAAVVPQIHAVEFNVKFDQDFFPLSPAKSHSSIRAVCKASRAEALKTQYPWKHFDLDENETYVGLYANWGIDILWVVDPYDDSSYLDGILRTMNFGNYFYAEKIAFKWDHWTKSTQFLDFEEAMDLLVDYREVYFITGGNEHYQATDLVFQCPSFEPQGRIIHSHLTPLGPTAKVENALGRTWEFFEGLAIQTIRDFQDIRKATRQKHKDSDIIYHPPQQHQLKDCSRWKIERVHFVEATTLTLRALQHTNA